MKRIIPAVLMVALLAGCAETEQQKALRLEQARQAQIEEEILAKGTYEEKAAILLLRQQRAAQQQALEERRSEALGLMSQRLLEMGQPQQPNISTTDCHPMGNSLSCTTFGR